MTQRFGPPGGVSDFDGIPHQLEAWDVAMASYFVHGVKRTEALVGRGHSQFFDPTRRPVTGGLTEQTITWNGFPKVLAEEDNPYRAADELRSARLDGRLIRFRPQDEYLEWHATTERGKIVAVDFTCEGPEYWTALAHGYPDDLNLPAGRPPASGDFGAVVRLYRRYVSRSVRPEDLLDGSRRYDPHNKWNTSHGAMHLTHPSNSLSAEVFLAADATVLRRRHGGALLEDDDELIRCAEYGEPRRASDPTI